MTGFAFDPWAALKMRKRGHPPPNPANPPNPPPPNAPQLGALGGLGGGALAFAKTMPPVAVVSDVPAAWREGVASLAALTPPSGITPARWAALAATSTYLLQSHGPELHRAGWDALDLFGLHRRAPATNPAGWGLAWLLGAAGEVMDVTSDAVGMRRRPDGARLAFRRNEGAVRAGVAPAWALVWP